MVYQGSCELVWIDMLVLTIPEMREHLPVVGLGSMRFGVIAALSPAGGKSGAIAIPADFERGRTGQEITRFYRQAARRGNCAAMRRLSEIYGKGIPGVSRDLRESLAWKADAECCGASPR
jgi:hypothetical protein